MNDNQTNEGRKVVTLKIRFLPESTEWHFPVAIRVVGAVETGEHPFVGSVELAAVRARNP